MKEEKETKPITREFINEFLLESQHRSGLPLINRLSVYYAQALSMVSAPDDMLDYIMDGFVNNYMIMTHKIHQIRRRQSGWKSYDW